MKTYVITISENFPATHSKKGQPTDFEFKILAGEKLHTIRTNYPIWKKRIEEVQNGNAILSVRKWEGKPYRSSQKELFRFDKSDGIGIEKLQFSKDIKTQTPTLEDLAKNDGLSIEDFNEWFKNADLSKPLVIIHFGKFRYNI